MSKYTLGLILTLALFSCKKDEPEIITKDYSSFLAKTTHTFYGNLDGKSFSWTFGWNQSQSIAGYENGYGVGDTTDPVRVVLYGLTSESDLQTRFRIYSPRYNSASRDVKCEM